MKADIVRFVIITVPSEPVLGRLTRLIATLSDLGDTRTAASYPPHVTLRTGLLVPRGRIDEAVRGLGETLRTLDPFPIRAERLMCETYTHEKKLKFIIYYKIKKSEALSELNARLLRYTAFRKSDRIAFHPHLSLAYEDLTQSAYDDLVAYLMNNTDVPEPDEVTWTCDNVCLYRKSGEKWKRYTIIGAAHHPTRVTVGNGVDLDKYREEERERDE